MEPENDPDLLAALAMELRHSLLSIADSIELLEEHESHRLSEPGQVLVSATAADVNRLQALVEDYATLAAAVAAQLDLRRVEFSLRPTLLAMAAAFDQVASEKALDFSVHLPDALPPVVGDPRLVEQAIIHLLANAMKFTPVGGAVLLSVSATAAAVCIEVSDAGPGIAADELDHVTERFFRGALAIEGDLPGSGLGLAIASSVARAHGGALRFVTQAWGGVSVVLELPLDAAD